MPRLAALFTILLAPFSFAQGAKGSLSVRFLAERAPAGLGQVILIENETASEPFDLPVNHLSTPVKPPARTFGVRSAEKAGLKLATVTLPEDGSQFIVVLVPSAKGGFSPIIIPGDQPSFKPGDTYFYNHSNKTVLGYVGTAKFILAPGKGQVVQPKGAREEGFYDVAFGVRDAEGDHALSSTRWPVGDRTRSYLFFFVNPETQRVSYRAVDEIIPQDEKRP